ncbi:MAG: protein kinase, partial [Acidobacteriaceae bacterium]|nr:protein kinase [Acidobacteriaceae bacterium]
MLHDFDSQSVDETASLELDKQPAYARETVTFNGTARFAVQRMLGSGAFGTVYQVWDREQHAKVALKVLHSRKPDVLFRFKREFRALVDVRHPNLVRLYELFSEGEQWFFTMECVEGEHFLEHVRPDGGSCRLERLRPALRQIVNGMQALHEAKLLHRDLKPANALVTDTGRVVILDFGLIREVHSNSAEQSKTIVAGTPAYMAPEALEGKVTEASDWYSVGVMLFQALTGRLPHAAAGLQRWLNPESAQLTEPRQIDSTVPQDLNDLCRELLRSSPAERADAAAVLAMVGADPPPLEPSPIRTPEAEIFVGRSAQFRELDTAFAETREGRFNVVLLHGPSGIGKSALIRRFLAVLAERHSNLLVLKGRCYEFESVPYKGLDALIDELSRYLQHLPDAKVEAVLPRDAFLLSKLFPVLGQVAAIARAPVRAPVVPDAQELRHRTFAALRELFARLSDRQPLVVWIDDLQWGDRDSSAFFAELCVPQQQPPLLLFLTYRSEEAASNPTLQYLHEVLDRRDVPGWRHLMLEKLSETESEQLLGQLLAGRTELTSEAQARICKESGGHPLFLQQLARFASSRTADWSIEGKPGKEYELTSVLRQRVSELSEFSRRVLDYICIAGQPLTPAVLFAAADAQATEEPGETLALLVHEKFARNAGTDMDRRIGAYHDQIRTAVVESMPPEVRKARHAKLASVLATQPEVEAQTLVAHYQEAGDVRAAYEAALKAARAASSK